MADPPSLRKATYEAVEAASDRLARPDDPDYTSDLLKILGAWDVCSKEWIVRQYDHEVQARTVIKPLVGVLEDGPGDASVILPVRWFVSRAGDQPAGSTPAMA